MKTTITLTLYDIKLTAEQKNRLPYLLADALGEYKARRELPVEKYVADRYGSYVKQDHKIQKEIARVTANIEIAGLLHNTALAPLVKEEV